VRRIGESMGKKRKGKRGRAGKEKSKGKKGREGRETSSQLKFLATPLCCQLYSQSVW